MPISRRDKILAEASDAADDLLDDSDTDRVSRREIIEAIRARELTIPDITAAFAVSLRSELEL